MRMKRVLHCERVLVNKLKGKSSIGKLVSIYKNTDAGPVAFVKDLLTEQGMSFIVKAANSARSHDEFRDYVEILVKEDDVQKARQVLHLDAAEEHEA